MNPNNNPYADLREIALNVTSEQLALPANSSEVYGVVMDLNLGDGIATLVSFGTGDASIYLSSGGGMIGGLSHQAVATAAKNFVAKAQEYISGAGSVDSTPLPGTDEVIFYFLTPRGRFATTENRANFEDDSS
ncbi:MAG TPA: hypothetical protein VEB42_02055, partial [Chitinophagaceae bacterium]|nr:hypothetical protein [Chitinophagaceae bacterium]